MISFLSEKCIINFKKILAVVISSYLFFCYLLIYIILWKNLKIFSYSKLQDTSQTFKPEKNL